MPSVTVVLPLSRHWRVEAMEDQLLDLDTDGIDVNLLVIVDSQDFTISWPQLKPQIVYMDENHPGEINAYARRQRIADIMNLARQHVPDSDYVFIVEDDTEIKSHYLKTLVETYQHLEKTYGAPGILSGVQAGRWASSMLGIWDTDNKDNPTIWETRPLGEGLEPCTATGIYCSLTQTKLFKDTPFRTTYQGPDVNFGLDLRLKDRTNWVKWDLICGHVTQTKTIYPTPETGTIKFIKDDLAPGGWKQVETVLS